MNIKIFSVPYDSGLLRTRMGSGPEHLLRSGLTKRLEEDGFGVEVRSVALPPGFYPSEVAAGFELARQLAALLRDARERGVFSLILSGNCGTAALGAIGGIGDQSTGVVWFDAHADFNTPETTVSGFLDGMALANVTGRCWHSLAGRIDGFQAIPEKQVVLVGARDLDSAEAKALAESEIARVLAASIGTGLEPTLHALAQRVREVYLHIDLDVIDTSQGRANRYACSGGLQISEVLNAIEAAAGKFVIHAASIASYDPAEDADHRIQRGAEEIILALVRRVRAQDQ